MHVPHKPNRVRASGGLPDTVLIAARRRLADRVADRIESGLEPAPCRGRVLESALALRLLDMSGHTRGRDELAAFLDARRGAEPEGTLDHVLAHCALTATPLPDGVVTSALAGFDHFTSGRKRALLRAIATVFGAPRTDVALDTPDRTGLHPWASAVLTASEVIIAGRASAEQRRELLATQRHQGIWDGHLLCHLLAAHALRTLPGTEDVVAGAVTRVLATRGADGGIPFIERLDIFCSALAGLGLANTLGGRASAHMIADCVASLQDASGGWGYATGVEQVDVDTTAVSLELLTLVDPTRFAAEITRGMAYLRDIRGADGGFPTYLRGAKSEVAMTAAAANALGLGSGGAEMLRGAAEFIARNQRDDGTFEPGWSRSNANTQCRVLLALHHADDVADTRTRVRFREAVTRTTARLVRDQNADGGWGHRHGEPSDPISTSFALIGLAHAPGHGAAVATGVRHLLAHQGDDGGFASRPDSSGPRGFVYDVPALADLYPLLALGHLTDPAVAALPA